MFKVGDEVVFLVSGSLILFEGVVISTNRIEEYPVLVRSEEKGDRTYTPDGRTYSDLTPSLFHKGTTITINEAPEPRRLPDLKVDDLVVVWGLSGFRFGNVKYVRHFSHYSEEGGVFAFDYNETLSDSGNVTLWENCEVYEK